VRSGWWRFNRAETGCRAGFDAVAVAIAVVEDAVIRKCTKTLGSYMVKVRDELSLVSGGLDRR
jgi:hypothetical protein